MSTSPIFSHLIALEKRYHNPLLGLLVVCLLQVGCAEEKPIVTYQIPTTVPAALAAEDTRMVAAILPQSDQAWFFKIMGRKSAVDAAADDFRRFVENIEFTAGAPVIGELPASWKRGANRPMRFASIDINTPAQQLDLSISQLARSDEWDALVTSNIVRWRKQVGLDATDEKWSGAEELKWAKAPPASDAGATAAPAIWLDVTGRPATAAGPAMMADAPFAQLGAAPTAADAAANPAGDMPADPHAGLPRATREQIAAQTEAAKQQAKTDNAAPMPAAKTDTASSPTSEPENTVDPASKLKYDRPEGWRDGRMSIMRLAAFDVGPEDAAAEVTIINAGGDLRGNVARWMGQIRKSAVSEAEVDAALQNAEKFELAGRPAERFVLLPEDADAEDASAIDATIIPIENGFSMFVKMTGPPATIQAQSKQMKSFIESIEF